MQAAPQTGLTQDYQELAGRLGGLEKALKALVGHLAKSESEDEEKDNFEKAVRKAKAAVRKAEDEDGDDDDKEEAFEKAERAILAAKAVVSKAEEDGDDEEKVEKAFKALKSHKATVKAVREKHVAAKAAAVAKAAEIAVPAVVEGAAAVVAEPTVADIAKGQASLVDQLGVVTKSLAEVMAAVAPRANPAAAAAAAAVASGQPAAPVVKAATPELCKAIAERIEEASDTLGFEPIMKAQSLLTRLRAVEAGTLSHEVFDTELDRQADDVKRLFAA